MSAQLDQQMNDILANLRAQQARIQAASERLGNASATATSKDHTIEAVVDSRGRITTLKLKGTGYRKLAPAELADRIMDAIRSAQDAVARQATDALAGLLPTGLGLGFGEGVSPDGTCDLDAMFDAAVRAVRNPIFRTRPADPRTDDA
jgi:DNA-binding protein YbaB